MTETNTSVIENLKLMMEASAWDGKLELSDALANIEQLRAALTEALAFNPDWADFNNGRECGRIEVTEALAAQPVREPLSIRWPHRVELISELGYVVWRDVFEGVMCCTLRDAVLAHKVALFVTKDEAVDYANYRNTRTATLGTDAIEPVKHGIGGEK